MRIRKDMIFAVLTTFCMSALMFAVIPIQSGLPYDPWMDINDDGKIDMHDIGNVAARFMASGEAINKTALLLDLQNRVSALEERQDYVKTIRFYTPNETMNNQTDLTDAAVFVWTPNNSTNNAILLISCYLQYWGEDWGEIPNSFLYGVFVEDRCVWTARVDTSENYIWSPIFTRELVPYSPSQYVFPNQENYTIKLRFQSDKLGLEVYVKNINILLEVMDGLPPS